LLKCVEVIFVVPGGFRSENV